MSTTIEARCYRWVIDHRLQFGSILNQSILARMRNDRDGAIASWGDPAHSEKLRALVEWVKERNAKGETTTPEELKAKRSELELP